MQKSKPGIFFIGIGGIGMSSLARWFKAHGWLVAGSDLALSSLTGELTKEGIGIFRGHKATNISESTGLVIQSQAIKADNPEVLRAKKLGIPLLTYPQAVGRITENYKTIAIAGAHGKSTTTALTGLVLMKAKFDPTIIVGTKLKELGGRNFRIGKSDFLVLEANEFGKAFLNYSPTYTIITNIDREHLDIYKTLANVKKTFLEFIARTKPGGTLVLNADNPELFSLKARIRKIATKRKLGVHWYSLSTAAAREAKAAMNIAGAHNLSNALAAYTLGRILGIPKMKILSAIAGYQGAWRRMEYKGEFAVNHAKLKVSVYDDYAHHPTEIKATLQAFREKYPSRTLVCVFQPHQAKRLEALYKEFQSAFEEADVSLLLPLYKVPGRDEKYKLDSESLVKTMQKKYPGRRIFYLADSKNLKNALNTLLGDPAMCGPEMSGKKKGAVIVMMGAGDIAEHTKKILTK